MSNYNKLLQIISIKSGVSIRQVRDVLRSYSKILTDVVISGGTITLPKVGKFMLSERKPSRMYLGNFKKWVNTPYKCTIKFKAYKSFEKKFTQRALQEGLASYKKEALLNT